MTAALKFRQLSVALAALTVAGAACAQYKIVGPDGRVTYTDKPPVGQQAQAGAGGAAANPSTSGLPYQTKQAMGRAPVTLYGGKNCGPCDQARGWLKQHGIPFSEYGVDSDDDIRAMQAKFGEARLPTVTVGSQAIKGFDAPQIEKTTLAAGYPPSVNLLGYHWPEAVPLAPPAAKVASPSATPSTPAAPQVPAPQPKSGIQF